jgi:hypothetical protein
MAALTKTQGTSLLSLQSVAASSVAVSSAVDVSTKFAATVFIHFGRRSASSAGAPAVLRVEASAKSSGEGHWYPVCSLYTDYAAVESEAVSGTVNASQNVITVASTTNLAAGDIIYIDNGTIANSEWGRIKSIVANTSVTIEDNLVNAQTGATLYDGAQMFVVQLDLSAIGRIRLVDDGSSFTQAHAVEAHIVTSDSLS